MLDIGQDAHSRLVQLLLSCSFASVPRTQWDGVSVSHLWHRPPSGKANRMMEVKTEIAHTWTHTDDSDEQMCQETKHASTMMKQVMFNCR